VLYNPSQFIIFNNSLPFNIEDFQIIDQFLLNLNKIIVKRFFNINILKKNTGNLDEMKLEKYNLEA